MSEFKALDKETSEILDDYDAAVKSGQLWIVNGHAVNTNDPTQVWGKFVSEKLTRFYDV